MVLDEDGIMNHEPIHPVKGFVLLHDILRLVLQQCCSSTVLKYTGVGVTLLEGFEQSAHRLGQQSLCTVQGRWLIRRIKEYDICD